MVVLHASAVPLSAAQPGRPNVIVFLADDQGWGDLGCHGNPYVQTPNLDAFAREAVELTQFHVSPVCSPTRASLMTGRYNFRTGVTSVAGGRNMDPQEVTVAEALRSAGYATGIFGKWHLGEDASRRPTAQGFDEAVVFDGAALQADQCFDGEYLHNDVPTRYKGYSMDVFTDAAIAFVKQHRSKPFFLYLPPNLIHTPLQVADDLKAPFKATGLEKRTVNICAMLKSMDSNFARLRQTLQELGLEERTLLIYTSDNGPCAGSVMMDRFMAGQHGLKGTVYENGIHVPCYMRWPAAVAAPGKVGRLTAHIDVMPTILDACGVPVPSGVRLDGRSLLPLLKNPSADWPDRTLFFQWDSRPVPRRGRAYTVLTERWKLVQPMGIDNPTQQIVWERYAELCKVQGRGTRTILGPPRCELYDIAADPGETKDLAAAHADIVEKMNRAYDAWFDDVAVRWLITGSQIAE